MASPSNGCPALRSRSAACRIALITNAVPVLAVGDGVLHGDPGRGLAVTGLLPRLEHLRGRVLGGLLRRDADVAGVVAVQAPVLTRRAREAGEAQQVHPRGVPR